MATMPRAEITETEIFMYNLSRWAAAQGWPYGVPIPSFGPSQKRLVIAKRAPFGDRTVPILSYPEMRGDVIPRELREKTEQDSWKLINSWIGRDGCRVFIIETTDGKRNAYLDQHPVVERFHRMIETIGARQFAVLARAEAKAMCNLADRLTIAQADSYVLNGCFIESSKRSKVRYLFRRGLPTIALCDRGATVGFLAALCLHPLAYFDDTFAGSMAPSDEVLAHLLMMRSDEHRFWKESNQHPIYDPRSGI